MRLLLDTHILLWWLGDEVVLPAQARTLISDPTNDCFISSLSLWEIAIKVKLGKIEVDVDRVHTAATASGLAPLPFTLDHAAAVTRLPDHHRDPFDRGLIAQAQIEPMHLLTHDEALSPYRGPVLLV